MRIAHIILIVIGLLSVFSAQHFTPILAATTVWPQPAVYQYNANGNTIGLIKALGRYSDYVFDVPKSAQLKFNQATRWSNFIPQVNSTGLKKVQFNTLTISLQNMDAKVVMDFDESYEITVPDASSAVRIVAHNQWGALRALETLSQLIVTTVVTDTAQIFAHSIVSLPVHIADEPRYKWRGIMIDVARHYLPVIQIKRIIDAMSFEKFNKLHIHLVDAQSSPIIIPEFEILAEKTALGPGLTYNAKQVAEIVTYANDRGIEIIPEWDTPGHAYAWKFAYPEAVSTCPATTTNIHNYPVQPVKQITYDIIDAMAKYSKASFGNSPYFHIGSDEVIEACWAQDPDVQKFMRSMEAKEQGIVTMTDLRGYFQRKVQDIALKHKRTMIAWEELALEVHTNVYKYPLDGLVQVWQLSKTLKNVTDLGYKAIMSAGFYLDKQKPDPSSSDKWLWIDTWENMYLNDPNKFVVDAEKRKLVLGVEACMWGESVSSLNIEARIWPRVSAVAERGWSPESVNNVDSARNRLINHICATMVKRGIRTGPVRPDYCPYEFTFQEDSPEDPSDEIPSRFKGALIASIFINVILAISFVSLLVFFFVTYSRYSKLKDAYCSDFNESASLVQ